MVLKYNITKRRHILLIDRVHMTDVILTNVCSARSRKPFLPFTDEAIMKAKLVRLICLLIVFFLKLCRKAKEDKKGRG